MQQASSSQAAPANATTIKQEKTDTKNEGPSDSPKSGE